MTVSVPQSELGVLETADGFRYQLTPEDALWLARAVQFEGGDRIATLWAFASRFAGFQRSGSFATFLRAYSQPINPLWDELTDEKCRRNPEMCTPAMIERRRLARTLTWNELSPRVTAEVAAFAKALVSNPVPGVVDFASYDVQAWLRRNPTSRIVKTEGPSWYATFGRSGEWPADFVRVRYGDRIATGTARGLGFFGALLIGAGAALGLVGLVVVARRWG